MKKTRLAVILVLVVLCAASWLRLGGQVLGKAGRVSALAGQARAYQEQRLYALAADAYLHGGALPENTELSGSELQTELNCDNMTLTIRLGIENSSYEILEWNCRSRWQPEEEQWNLWRK